MIEQTEIVRTGARAVNGPTAGRSRSEIVQSVINNPLLPPPPALALQIVEKVSDPDCEMNDVCRMLMTDPPLCAKLLKLVNSPLIAPVRPITAISQAVSILGFNRLRSMVLGASIPAMQLSSGGGKGLATFWRCSTAGAIIARELAVLRRHPFPEDDMVAALLRDLGIILLRQSYPEVYGPVWTGSRLLAAGQRCRWEQQEFGIEHAEVTAELLRSWRLPTALVDPIRYHHAPDQGKAMPKPLAQRATVLEFADRLAELEDVQSGPADFDEIWRIAKAQFGMDPDELEKFLGVVTPKIEEFASLLQLDIGNSPKFAQVLYAGCTELARLATEATEKAASGSGERKLPSGHDSAFDTRGVAPPPADGQPRHHAEVPLLTPGSRLRDYEIRRLIGRGAMGIVYEAFDVELSRLVAIKTLAPERTLCPQTRQRFMREARTAAAVSHENVVTVFAAGEEAGVLFLVMAYVRGRSLQDWLNTGRRFTADEIARIGRETALGLAAAHAHGILHRDIKPANVLLEEGTERPRITDFGLARTADSTALTQDGFIVGTPQFMSPEQVEGLTLTSATDLFSLGSLLYAMCAGKPPFDGPTVYTTLSSVTRAAPTPVRSLMPDIPHRLEELIEKLHARDPAQRPTAAAAAEWLRVIGAKFR